jgi:hypothetical protein
MKDETADARRLTVGQLRRQVRLGTEAIYRVCGYDAGAVEVEVIRAPGLSQGQTFRFSEDAVCAMELVDDFPATT